MKIRERWLTIACIALFIVMLLSGFGYINSSVSYKYEVQDFLASGPQPAKNLDEHQKEIIKWLAEDKAAFIISTGLFLSLVIIGVTKPGLKGRLQYI